MCLPRNPVANFFMLTFYIAAAWDNRAIAKNICDQLEANGLQCTMKWWTHEDPTQSREYCMKDVKGVIDADIFILYYDKTSNSSGHRIELGIAIGRGKPCCILNDPLTTVFKHTTMHVSIDDLLTLH